MLGIEPLNRKIIFIPLLVSKDFDNCKRIMGRRFKNIRKLKDKKLKRKILCPEGHRSHAHTPTPITAYRLLSNDRICLGSNLAFTPLL